jgi:hypothetical protein
VFIAIGSKGQCIKILHSIKRCKATNLSFPDIIAIGIFSLGQSIKNN